MAEDVLQCIADGDTKKVQSLIGDVDAVIYKDGKRALHVAAIYGHAHIASWLLAEGGQVDCLDQGDHTPLHLAAKYGHTSVMEVLIASGANVNTANRAYKLTPLHMAAKEGQAEAVQVLVQAGAFVSVCAKDGIQPIHTAVEKGHKEVVALLIHAGAAPDARDSIGFTPLHLAIENKQESLVALMLRLGADPDAKNKNGWTPLHLAASIGSAAFVRLLVEHGADLTAVNSAGKTPMDVAVDRQHAVVVPLLNPATAAQLISPSRMSSSTTCSQPDHTHIHRHSDSSYSPTAAAPAGALSVPVGHVQLEHLMGGLGLQDNNDIPCPYCNVTNNLDPRSVINPHGNPGSLSHSNSRDSTRSFSSTGTAASVEGVPGLFVCPLSHKLLRDPVVACDGFTYDRRAIQQHFEQGDRTSPLTRQLLRSTAVLPNHSIRCAVNEWLEWRDRKIRYLQQQQVYQQQLLYTQQQQQQQLMADLQQQHQQLSYSQQQQQQLLSLQGRR